MWIDRGTHGDGEVESQYDVDSFRFGTFVHLPFLWTGQSNDQQGKPKDAQAEGIFPARLRRNGTAVRPRGCWRSAWPPRGRCDRSTKRGRSGRGERRMPDSGGEVMFGRSSVRSRQLLAHLGMIYRPFRRYGCVAPRRAACRRTLPSRRSAGVGGSDGLL